MAHKILNLCEEIDGPWRAYASDPIFWFFNGYSRRISWTPFLYSSGVFFINDEEYLDWFEKVLDDGFRESRTSVNIHNLRNVSGALPKVVDEVHDASVVLSRKCKENGVLSPPNRKTDVIFVNLDDGLHKLSKLQRRKLVQIVKHSNRFRISLLMYSRNVKKIPDELLDGIPWQVFLGDENMDFSLARYSEMERGLFHPNQILLGNFYSNQASYLSVVHSRKHIPSEYKKLKVAREKIARKTYQQFLESIPDGN